MAVNKVILLGRIGQEPETKDTPSGAKVTNFSLATSEKFKDAQGNQQEKTEWHNCVAWQKTAELIQKYVHKGDQLYLEGKLETRSWEDTASGQKRYKTEIIVHKIDFISNGNKQEQKPQEPQGFGGTTPADSDSLPF